MIWRIAALILLTALPLRAEEQGAATGETIVAGLSQNRVEITADFAGSEILVYGAVKRSAPPPGDQPLHVIITAEGPPGPLTVRRKERVAGIWVNNSSVTIDSAPSFYAVASTGPLGLILTQTEDQRYRITMPRTIRAIGISDEAENAQDFTEALTRIYVRDGRYRLSEDIVRFTESTLFRTDLLLPANLTEGDYRVRIFLVRGGKVIDQQERRIGVGKEGLARLIFNSAHDQPLIYALVALLVAVVAGWGASEVFRRLRF